MGIQYTQGHVDGLLGKVCHNPYHIYTQSHKARNYMNGYADGKAIRLLNNITITLMGGHYGL